MSKPNENFKHTSVWLDKKDLERIDNLIPKVKKISGGGRIPRSAVMRLVVSKGLEVLEKELEK